MDPQWREMRYTSGRAKSFIDDISLQSPPKIAALRWQRRGEPLGVTYVSLG